METAVATGRTVSVALALPFIVAVIEGVCCEVTVWLVTVKFAVVAPAATFTDAGTVAAAVLLLDNVTISPPVGAGAVKVTVAVEFAPPATDVGFRDNERTPGGLTDNWAVAVPFSVAVIVGVTVEVTAIVLTVKLAVVAPPGTVTEVPTTAAALLLDSPTATPAAGAALLNVTVPVEELPPRTLVGLRVTETTEGATTVNWAVAVPFNVPVIVAVAVEAIATVLTVKLAVVVWAGTVTLAGTIAAALLLVRATTPPPVSAGVSSVTVPDEGIPPAKLDGFKDTDEMMGAMAVTWSDPVDCVPV